MAITWQWQEENMYIRTYVHTSRMYYVRAYLCTYVRTYSRTCTHTYVSTHVNTKRKTCRNVSRRLRIYHICICVHTYIYIHTKARTYIHMYAHISKYLYICNNMATFARQPGAAAVSRPAPRKTRPCDAAGAGEFARHAWA